MHVVLRKYGNSTVAVLPSALLRELGLAAGQAMALETNAHGHIVRAPSRNYTLAELIAPCDPKARTAGGQAAVGRRAGGRQRSLVVATLPCSTRSACSTSWHAMRGAASARRP